MHCHQLLSPCRPATPPRMIRHVQVDSWKCVPVKAHIWCSLEKKIRQANFVCSWQLDFLQIRGLYKGLSFAKGASTISWELKDYRTKFTKIVSSSDNCKRRISVLFVRLVVGVVLFMSVSFAAKQSPSWALTEENRLFLEAWRTIDRAYVDKTFNGQNWFRYRENALRNEPMNTREETYMAIRKMVASLNDPFTRFLEPEKLKSLRAVRNSKFTYRCRAVHWLPYQA